MVCSQAETATRNRGDQEAGEELVACCAVQADAEVLQDHRERQLPDQSRRRRSSEAWRDGKRLSDMESWLV